MRIGGARWCFSSARCRFARISRSRDVYDFMGQLPWYTGKLVCGRVVPLFFPASLCPSLPLTQPSSPSISLFSRKRRVRVHVRSTFRRQAFDRHFDGAFEFSFPISSAEQSEMFRAVDGSRHRKEQPTSEDISATNERLSRRSLQTSA